MDHSPVTTDDKQNSLQEGLDGERESSSPEMLATIHPAYSKPSQIARMLSQNPSPSNILSLQRTVGNRVVQRLLHPPEIARADEEEQTVKEGTLPDQQLEEDVKQLKGPEEEHKEDGTNPKNGRAATAGEGSSSPPSTFQLSVGNMGVEFNNPQIDISSNPGAKDAVESGTVGTEWTNPGTKTVKPFGSESFIPGYKNLKWKAGDDKAKPSFKVDFTLNIDCPWGVNDGGKADVPSATDGVVTAEPHASGKKVYEQIIADLTPAKKEKSWVAPRQYFWSKAICSRHETFHSTDDKAWAETTGKKLVTDYLNAQTVSADKTEDDLKVHLTKAMKDLGTANFAFYTGGAGSYYSYSGEERAFGDGKAPYEQLVKEVGEQGVKLEAAKTGGSTSSVWNYLPDWLKNLLS